MKYFEFNEENVIINIKREKRMKILKAAVCLPVGIVSLWLIQSVRYFNFYRDMANNIMLFVLGVTFVLGTCGFVFTFAKKSPVVNVALRAAVSLLLGVLLFRNITTYMAERDIWPGLENDLNATILAVATFHFLYSFVIFNLSMLISHLYKKMRSKRIGADVKA